MVLTMMQSADSVGLAPAVDRLRYAVAREKRIIFVVTFGAVFEKKRLTQAEKDAAKGNEKLAALLEFINESYPNKATAPCDLWRMQHQRAVRAPMQHAPPRAARTLVVARTQLAGWLFARCEVCLFWQVPGAEGAQGPRQEEQDTQQGDCT